ncbi:MAG: hypothetical protein AABW81_01735 [Nanoarchaeota archaeon]
MNYFLFKGRKRREIMNFLEDIIKQKKYEPKIEKELEMYTPFKGKFFLIETGKKEKIKLYVYKIYEDYPLFSYLKQNLKRNAIAIKTRYTDEYELTNGYADVKTDKVECGMGYCSNIYKKYDIVNFIQDIDDFKKKVIKRLEENEI